jgi:hypothetical protein
MVKIIKLKDCYRDKGDDLDIFMVKYSDVNYIEYSDVIVDFLNKSSILEIEDYLNNLSNKYKVCKFLYKNSIDEDTKIYRHLKTIWRNNAIDIILN